ncbi:MAG: hypothetical protein J2P17_08235 [Mycobacterium sp.]|nr:hypothetical protein [Mycobacterium sp.]
MRILFRNRRRIAQLEADYLVIRGILTTTQRDLAKLRHHFAEYRLDHGAGPEDLEAGERYLRNRYGNDSQIRFGLNRIRLYRASDINPQALNKINTKAE